MSSQSGDNAGEGEVGETVLIRGIPSDLLAEIGSLAREERRSRTAQIIVLLEESMQARRRGGDWAD